MNLKTYRGAKDVEGGCWDGLQTYWMENAKERRKFHLGARKYEKYAGEYERKDDEEEE